MYICATLVHEVFEDTFGLTTDHCTIMIKLSITVKKKREETRTIRKLRNIDTKNFREELKPIIDNVIGTERNFEWVKNTKSRGRKRAGWKENGGKFLEKEDRERCRQQSKLYVELAAKKQEKYLFNLIEKYSSKQKSLFKVVSEALD